LADLLWVKGKTAEAADVLKTAVSKGNLDASHDRHVARAYANLAKLSAATEDNAATEKYAARAAAMGAEREVAHLLSITEKGSDPQQALLAGVSIVLKTAADVLTEGQFKALRASVATQLGWEEGQGVKQTREQSH